MSRSIHRILGATLTLTLALAGCEPAPSIPAALGASAPDCAARCVEPSGPAADDIPCIREACAPAGEAQTAGVT